MVKHRHNLVFWLVSAALIISGCNTTKRLGDDELLLQKNKIKFDDAISIDTDNLDEAIRQKPNRKVLGIFPLYVWAYNVPNPDKFEAKNEKRLEKLKKKNEKRKEKGKELKELKPYGSWWRETVGEPPVVYDHEATRRSVAQLETYLLKRGWFNATVSADSTVDGKKVTVTYRVEAGKPYEIDTLRYSIPDSSIYHYTLALREKRKTLRHGDQFNIDELNEEREALNDHFRNLGYYDFNKELIYFDVDSNLSKHAVELTLGITPRRIPYSGDPDSLVVAPYKRYKINSITVMDIPAIRNESVPFSDTLEVQDYIVIDQGQLNIKPKILYQNILFKKGEYYQLESVTRTYRRLSALPRVRSTSVRFTPTSDDPENTLLDCTIRLSPSPKQNISFESRGTNRGGFLGVAGSAAYQNKNVFGGAELFSFNLTGGFEAQQLLTQSGSTDDLRSNFRGNSYFNTLEFGPEVSLTFPRFLLPFKPQRFAKSSDPKTTLTANLSYQSRPDYERTRSFGSIAYKWNETAQKSWVISPLEVSLIKINRSDAFNQQLEDIGDLFLTNSFQDHFILDSRIVYTYNTQRSGSKSKNLYFYRAELEGAGNTLRGFYELAGAQQNENGSYEALGIPFAQYVKTLHDFRYYRNHNDKMSTAYRISGGIGVPLENLNVLPFEKSFFGGGANDIRAWQARTLGPGSYRDPERNFDKIGDILLQANAEYRFDLIDVVEAAFFIDAGNIWTINADPARPGADFDVDRFVSEIAFGAGTGLRLNFDFFLIRLDLGLQLKDPSLDRGERWLFQPKNEYNEYIRGLNADRPSDRQLPFYKMRWNLNLGIGYPF